MDKCIWDMAYRKSLCASTVLVQAKQFLSTLIQENSYFLEEKKREMWHMKRSGSLLNPCYVHIVLLSIKHSSYAQVID